MADIAKIKQIYRSISGVEYIDFDPEISIALEYTGFPMNDVTIPMAFPLVVDRIPTAKVAPSLYLLNNLSLPVAEPIVKSKKLGALCSKVTESKVPVSGVSNSSLLGKTDDGVDSSGTLGFSDSEDHSHELSQSSEMVETPVEIVPQCVSVEICCEDEESSDGEKLECRRKKRPLVTFCDPETTELTTYEEESEEDYDDLSARVIPQRPVSEKPAKKGACYHCRRGSRFTEKEPCIVCDAKYCKLCVRRAMGSMPQGRKCIGCIGYSINESKFHLLGKCSRLLKQLLSECEVERVLWDELYCPANQLPHLIIVNDKELSLRKLMMLRNCPNPPRNLKPGRYWYDKSSGFWGKEGYKPCQIVTPLLDIGGQLRRDASNGDTNVLINGREITRPEMLMMKSAGAQCAGNPCFWVDKDGGYQLEGMNKFGKIWERKKTKILCTLLALPTPESPNPTQVNHASRGSLNNIDQRALCKLLLVGNDNSGTSTIYKQARIIHGNPFSEQELQNIKFIIQRNLCKYLGILLKGRAQFEEECLLAIRKKHSVEESGTSDNPSDILEETNYTIGPKLKNFSDLLINSMVWGNLDGIFPASSREYAPYVEEMWKDAAIQATYNRRDELDLPRVANYFLDKAVEIAQMDYDPSDTDILYAEGFTSFNGLVSMEFSLDKTSEDVFRDRSEQMDVVTQFELVRVHTNSLGANCKWLDMFEDSRVVLFCVSLTEYDEYEVKSNGMLTNKMMESKKLFENIVTHPKFDDTNFLLLLNKFDLLEEKIELKPLTQCEWFKDFDPVLSHHHNSEGNGNNLPTLGERAFHYIGVKFKRLFRSLTGRNLYVCPVTAVESDSVKSALKYAREIVEWEEENLNSCVNESSCESFENEQSSCSSH